MEDFINKKQKVEALFYFLADRESHMSISNMQRDFLFALRRFDVEKEKVEMSERSKVNAKYALLVTYETINTLLDNVKRDEMNGQMSYILVIDQSKTLFEIDEAPAV
jgi:hypothetical protein